ncbi:hypothetical protein [Kitasatospora sp. NPDC088346]|uniref:hypothetical protein n=1 Tax=Kitasatospora sp. NPDC088346 TaxID=3364073 RepID=UPI0037F4BDCB
MTPQTDAQRAPGGRHRGPGSGLAAWLTAATVLGGSLVLLVALLGTDGGDIGTTSYRAGYQAGKQSGMQVRNTAEDVMAVGRACSNLAGESLPQGWYDGCSDALAGSPAQR